MLHSAGYVDSGWDKTRSVGKLFLVPSCSQSAAGPKHVPAPTVALTIPGYNHSTSPGAVEVDGDRHTSQAANSYFLGI